MKIAIIGCGVMGSAFARFWAQKHEVYLCGRDPAKLQDLSSEIKAPILSSEEAAQKADVILLSFKPKDLKAAAKSLSPYLAGKIVISILSGADTKVLESSFPKTHIVRTMPNLALTSGEGIIGVADSLDPPLKAKISDLFSGMGLVYFLPESKMEGFTALCGSSPAFIYVMLEAMMEGGVALGFSFDDAKELVIKAFEGAIALLKDSGKHPAELKMQISSPGGTTIAGLNEMEKQGVRSGLIKTLFACYHRASEMAEQHKKTSL